ncbi:MAG TPA: hypothetical protein PLW98_00415 [Bacillota bacterium]|nr:hypothetical protein [Bacillota bacterium]
MGFAINTAFTPGFILKTVFRYTFENQRYFAEYCINCDKSLVYKWINDTVILPKKHIAAITRFSIEQTNDSEKLQIRNILQQELSLLPLCDESRISLLEEKDFGKFLNGALLYAIAFRTEQQNTLQSKVPDAGINLSKLLICVFFAIFTGGILWTCLNRLLGWAYFMGGSGNEPVGLPSIIWGIFSNMPIIVCALIAAGKNTNLPKRIIFALIILYTLFSGIGALIFYNSGLRIFIEQAGLSYVLQECTIASIYGLVISGLPLLSLYLILHRVGIPILWHIAGIFLPPAAAILAVLGVCLINKPELEIAQLRGFLVAFTLRLCMFIIAYLYISDILPRNNKLAAGAHISGIEHYKAAN